MSLLHKLRLRIAPPSIADPDFGRLLFMYIPNSQERSYWECEWPFPKTGTVVSIGLPGAEAGPTRAGRQFYLALSDRFEEILAAARPKLEQVFQTWLGRELPADVFTVVKLSGFHVEDPEERPTRWSVSFEATGDRWLGITVPFIADQPQEAIVDT
jgi:hypothetical protein